jgi:tetratricopeptide (TPR) repeat protein
MGAEAKVVGRRNKVLGTLVFLLTTALAVGGVFVARTFLRAPGAADGAVDRIGAPALTGAGSGSGVSEAEAAAKQEAAKKDASAVTAILEAAKKLSQDREVGKAEVVLARGVEEHPYEPELRVAHAQSLVAAGKFADAYKEYEAAISLNAEHKGASGTDKWKVKTGGIGDPKLHFEAGTVANKAGLVDRAEEHYSMAQVGDPSEPKYPLYLAMIQLKLGKEDPAMASLVRAVKLDPDLAEAWGTMAELALKNNKLGLAAQHIERARRLQADVVRWRVVEARILKRQGGKGDVEKAAALLTAMDKSERQKPEVMSALAECYGMLRRPGDAAAMYAEAAAAKPTDGDLWYQAAVWSERAGDADKAMQYARASATRGNADGREMVKRLEGK